MAWSPLGWVRPSGKIRRRQPPQAGRIASGGAGGIMLPNHAPLIVTEQIGTLAQLYRGGNDLSGSP